MTEPYPDHDRDDHDQRVGGNREQRSALVWIGVVVALLVLVLILHLSGVIGPGLHGGGHAP